MQTYDTILSLAFGEYWQAGKTAYGTKTVELTEEKVKEKYSHRTFTINDK